MDTKELNYYGIGYIWRGEKLKEIVSGKNLDDAIFNFLRELHKETTSYERVRAGFKLNIEGNGEINMY